MVTEAEQAGEDDGSSFCGQKVLTYTNDKFHELLSAWLQYFGGEKML